MVNVFLFDQVVDFVDSQYETYLDGEARVNRRPISDTRVHACLYFIAPSGHGLKVSILKYIPTNPSAQSKAFVFPQ